MSRRPRKNGSAERNGAPVASTLVPGTDELYFLPLGGVGEIGMNLGLYGHAGRWLMVDLGVSFADGRLGGVELLMPDISFIERQAERLDALVLTHGHEDHLGAVPFLWERLGGPPVYATPFTAALLERKLADNGQEGEIPVTVVPLGGRFSVGPFDLELLTWTHSIPEPNGLVIRTAAGTTLHTGDWKFDEEPVLGEGYDLAAMERLGQEGLLAVIGDSTNATVPGHSGSEGAVRRRLAELIAECKGRVAVTCFASNVARLDSVMEAARRAGRRVCLVGRSMRRIYEVARETGYLDDPPPMVSIEEAEYLPREELLYLLTGSQGEPRAALSRIVEGDHPQALLEPGDTVFFSARVIPGNEVAVGTIQNALALRGIEVITDDDEAIHCSGHPAQEELQRLYQILRPQILVPAHGEGRHLAAHAELARLCQIPEVQVTKNGTPVRLAPGPAGLEAPVESGVLALDGSRLIPAEGAALRGRRRAGNGGVALAVAVVDEDGLLDEPPRFSLIGLIEPEEHDRIISALEEASEVAVERLGRRQRRDDAALAEALRLAVRRCLNDEIGRRPLTVVEVVRL